MSEALMLGVDVGTSAVDACAFSPDGQLVAVATVPLRVEYPRPGWAEQDAAAWAEAAVVALGRLTAHLGPAAGAVVAIGLTGQCPSFALVDDAGTPLTPGLIYQDIRATAEAARLAESLGAGQVFARTGMWPSHFYVAPKAMWLGAHRPALRARRPWLAQSRDLVAQRLTGTLATDETHAGCTCLYDLHARRWAADWVEALDLGWLRLPPVLPPAATVGSLRPAIAGEAGLPAGLPVVIGAADNFAADLGMGAIVPGLLGDATGTATCLDLTVDSPGDDPILTLYAHFTPGRFFANAGLNATGATIAWAAEVLAGGDLARLEALAGTAPPDAAAPLLLPYLGGGERADATATGVWHGLTLAHSPARLARSVYEGVSFALRELVDHFRAAGHAVVEARAGGGGSLSPLWNGLKSDIWNLPVRRAEGADVTALGAAMQAGVAAGIYRDLEEAAAGAVRLLPARAPDPANRALYEEVYRRWRSLRV